MGTGFVSKNSRREKPDRKNDQPWLIGGGNIVWDNANQRMEIGAPHLFVTLPPTSPDYIGAGHN
jgi:hypothetical protein